MASTSRGRTDQFQLLQAPKKWKERETSPGRTKVWTEPNKPKTNRRLVPVVYYLSRNGQLEHPHFIEVPLSSPEGLFLRDVICRLNSLRGTGMATQYSWSSKRSYKNGFVWQDLEENDLIHPVHGQEYVLKGSEILELTPKLPALTKSGEESDFAVRSYRRNQSWSSIDLHEYKVYKTEPTGDSARKAAADASTQTDEKRRRRRAVEEEERGRNNEQSTELSREEISPPPSDSSPETLESLMKADGRLVLATQAVNQADPDHSNLTAINCPSGRIKASSVLMSLISCGSISFRDCGATTAKDHGFSLISHYRSRLPRDDGNQVEEHGSSVEKTALEDKEYFSGSLLETRKEEFIPSLKRSSSYTADRSSHLKLTENEIEGVRAKCIPTRPKPQPQPPRPAAAAASAKKEISSDMAGVTISRTQDADKSENSR